MNQTKIVQIKNKLNQTNNLHLLLVKPNHLSHQHLVLVKKIVILDQFLKDNRKYQNYKTRLFKFKDN